MHEDAAIARIHTEGGWVAFARHITVLEFYNVATSHRGQFPYRDYFHIGRAHTRATFLDVLFGFLYLYIHSLFGLATSI